MIWVLPKHYDGQWYKSFHLLISHFHLLLHENWFLFEAMSLTASHCAFAKSMWRHENSSKNIRSPPHHRSSSKMFVSFNKTYPLKQMNICPPTLKFGGPFWKENPVSTNPSFFGKESTGLVEQRHASAKSAESSIQQRGLVLGGLGAWWFWDSIGVLTLCTSDFYPFHKRIPTASKPLGPKPPINQSSADQCFPKWLQEKMSFGEDRVDETSAVITVDGSFWLI